MSSEAHPDEANWQRVRVGLRNIRRIRGRVEHPCHVLHAVLLEALRPDRGAAVPIWCWHPAGTESWPDWVEQGRLYPIAVIIAGSDLARRFCERLSRVSLRNFELESLEAPERRSLTLLQAETPAPEWTSEEVCLDFVTPLAWEGKPGPLRWQLDTARLIRMVHHRLALFLGFPEPSPEANAHPSLEVRAEFTERVGGHPHHAKSSPGTELAWAGLRGPVYLRGDWSALWSPLLLCSELQLGSNTPRGQGCYRLVFRRPFFDPKLVRVGTWQKALSFFRHREQLKGKEPDPTLPLPEDLPGLVANAAAGGVELAPATLYALPKKELSAPDQAAATRLIAVLSEREQFVHYVLHWVLQPSLERLFVAESIGCRKGLSREDARPLVAQALAAGATHVVAADIEDFFDHIDWAVLEDQLRRCLPRGDAATLALLRTCLRQPLQDPQGHPLVRQGGLLQGSPLSPLLANLYLHDWDLAMRTRQRRFIRAMDDLRIFANSETEAKVVLADAASLLEPLGLRFNPAKTSILDLRAHAGFRFLGLTFGTAEPATRESGAGLRRTVYLLRPETWAGVDGGALVLCEGTQLDQRIPLHRVADLVLLGAGGISTDLIDACLRLGIPVSFGNQAGRHLGTLYPDARLAYARIARHHHRHEQLGWNGRVGLAARVVQAKLGNYFSWIDESRGAPTAALRRLLRLRHEAAGAAAAQAGSAAAINVIRGHEGVGSRHLFSWINGRVADREWASTARLPHERRDRWNLLLDTLSFLLFNRLHAGCRGRGLDPWLGFLHSPEDRYPSLIYDLMEPFRARLHRFAVWLVNEGAITPALTALDAQGRWGFTADGWRALLLQFEKQLDTAYAADQGRTWRQLLERQVEDLVLWVDQGVQLRLYALPIPPWRKPPAESQKPHCPSEAVDQTQSGLLDFSI